MSKYASITLSFDHFHFHPTAQLVPDLILTMCQTKIAERESFYLLELTCVWDSGSSFQAAMDRKMERYERLALRALRDVEQNFISFSFGFLHFSAFDIYVVWTMDSISGV